jgi:hypothetical protein
MVATQPDLKEQIVSKLDPRSDEALANILDFVEYQRFKQQRAPSEQPTPPYKPVKLGGLWPGLDLSEEEIDELRREVWRGLGDLNNIEECDSSSPAAPPEPIS